MAPRAARPIADADHDLLGDEVLVEAIGRDFLELLAEGRVLHVGVERDDARDPLRPAWREPCRTPRGWRPARRPCRRAARSASGRRRRAAARPASGSAAARSPSDRHGHELRLELGDRAVELLALLERLAVPAVLALRRTTRPLPLIVRATIIVGCPLVRRASAYASRIAFMSWPSIDDGVPAERAPAASELLEVVLPHRRPALAERVDVGDPAQIVEPVDGGDVRRLPDRSFRRLAIAEQTVGAVVRLDAACVQRNADSGADTLAERAGRHVHERQPRRRMTFEIGSDPPQLQQLGAIERARLGPRGVQNRRRVTFREHEPIAAGVPRLLRIETHLSEEQRGDEVGRRAATGRMSAARLGRRPDRSRFEGASRHFSGRESSDERSSDILTGRLQIVDFRLQIVLQIVSNPEIQSATCNLKPAISWLQRKPCCSPSATPKIAASAPWSA